MEAFLQAYGNWIFFGVFLLLMLLMHSGHGMGHGQHNGRPAPQPAPAEPDAVGTTAAKRAPSRRGGHH